MKDPVIVSSVRSAGGRAKRGALKDTLIDSVASEVVKGALDRVPGLNPEDINDVIMGCAFPEAQQGLNIARAIALNAGLPESVPGMTVNRFCSSGLQAIALAHQSIAAGFASCVVAGGLESMTMVPMTGVKIRPNPYGRQDVYIGMGITAEVVAEKYGVDRTAQDELAVRSHARAAKAQGEGFFKDEIVPVTAWKFAGGERETFTFDADDGIRPDTTVEGLARLRPAFKQGGTVTAGNSSQMTDGAAATVVMDLDKAKEVGAKPIARIKGYAVVGVKPDEMGVGPRYAIPKALEQAGLELGDIDLIELNEAFAAQAIYCIRELGLDKDKVNVCGGAMALGHPLGCTGAKLTATLLSQLKRLGKKHGVVSMCIGGGMGAAAVFEMLD